MLREGLSASAGLRSFREGGGRVGNEAWYRAWGNVAASIAKSQEVSLAPLTRRPAASELTQWGTTSARGYLYQVEIQVRGRGSGEVWTTFGSFRSSNLVTYGDALSGAMDHFADEASEYGEVVLGGVVTGVYQLEPEG